jgi:hypothetical protein
VRCGGDTGDDAADDEDDGDGEDKEGGGAEDANTLTKPLTRATLSQLELVDMLHRNTDDLTYVFSNGLELPVAEYNRIMSLKKRK